MSYWYATRLKIFGFLFCILSIVIEFLKNEKKTCNVFNIGKLTERILSLLGALVSHLVLGHRRTERGGGGRGLRWPFPPPLRGIFFLLRIHPRKLFLLHILLAPPPPNWVTPPSILSLYAQDNLSQQKEAWRQRDSCYYLFDNASKTASQLLEANVCFSPQLLEKLGEPTKSNCSPVGAWKCNFLPF